MTNQKTAIIRPVREKAMPEKKATAKPKAKKAAPRKSAAPKNPGPGSNEKPQICARCVKMVGLELKAGAEVVWSEDIRHCDQCGRPEHTADRDLFE